MRELEDVKYETDEGIAVITINRPDRMNAFRARTVEELIQSFMRAPGLTEASAPSYLPELATGPSAPAAIRSNASKRGLTGRPTPNLGCSRSSVCTRRSEISRSR